MKKNPSRRVLTFLFGFYEILVSLCSYLPKKNKAMNLLFTVHNTKQCEDDAMKPLAILHYNKNKIGVDCMDQMVTSYSTKRLTKRWTYAFFCNALDAMALTAYCICKENDMIDKHDERRTFLYFILRNIGTFKHRISNE